MTLSPTALEEAAKAISISTGDEPSKLTYAREMQCSGNDREPQYRWQYWTEHATAAITSYLAQAGKEGWVMVPVEPSCDQLAAGMEAWGRLDDAEEEVEAIYTEMLAAAQNGGDQ